MIKRKIARIESGPRGFVVTPADDDTIQSHCVLVAVGIGSFAWRLPEFEGLRPSVASHSSEHRALSR